MVTAIRRFHSRRFSPGYKIFLAIGLDLILVIRAFEVKRSNRSEGHEVADGRPHVPFPTPA